MNNKLILISIQILLLILLITTAIIAMSSTNSSEVLTLLFVINIINIVFFALLTYSISKSSNLSNAIKNYTHQKLPLLELNSVLHLASALINRLPWIEKQQELTTKLLIITNEYLQTCHQTYRQTLDQSKQLMQQITTLLGGLEDSVIVINQDSTIRIFNPAATQLTGHSHTMAIGKPVDQIILLQDNGQPLSLQKICNEIQDNHKLNNIRLIGPNHKLLYINLSIGKIHDNEEGWLISIKDVTEEQDLMRMKLDFASMAAHELRTPLTTVQGYLSFLQNPKTLNKLDPGEQEFINKATLSTSRLNRLIENVLSVSKIEQGKLALTFQPIQMDKLIQKLVNEYEGLAKTKNLDLLYIPYADEIPEIMADNNKIEEVISNLIGNAVKYTERGFIEISCRVQGDYIIVSVADTGKGIPSDSVGQLFTKFFRVQGELKSGSKGTGLGLYICKNIIESHGGKIWVESVLNQGSTFSFSIPINNSQPTNSASESQTNTPSQIPSESQPNQKMPDLSQLDPNIKLPDILLKKN